MASSKNMMAVAAVLVLVLASSMMESEAAISCGTVSGNLAQCLSYLQGKVASPSAACCSGVKSLYSATKNSKPDRVTSCNCIKNVATQLGSSLSSSSVSNLPGKCGVNLGYSISTATNCNSWGFFSL